MKMIGHNVFTGLVGILFLANLAVADDASSDKSKAESFSKEQVAIKANLENLFKYSREVNDKNASVKSKARKIIGGSLDWKQVAKDCLGADEWNKQTAANRSNFENLLQDVVLKTAFQRLDKFWTANTTYSFQSIEVTGDKSHVGVEFVIDDEEFLLDYYLQQKNKQWYIVDIAYEEMRYSENIREQINSFLKESDFNKLLGKLKKRRGELVDSTKAAESQKKKSSS